MNLSPDSKLRAFINPGHHKWGEIIGLNSNENDGRTLFVADECCRASELVKELLTMVSETKGGRFTIVVNEELLAKLIELQVSHQLEEKKCTKAFKSRVLNTELVVFRTMYVILTFADKYRPDKLVLFLRDGDEVAELITASQKIVHRI